ncbi:MAG: alpha/beta hydrolase [Spirochaetaceae bacterium]|nr:MAG: alpha/beta hydrolase [Spirochaetaceae bacterium]
MVYFDSTFGRVYYEVHGPRTQDGQELADEPITVLFAHGVTMDHRTFESQISALETRFRVVCLDLPGHGQSEKVDLKGPYSRRAAHAINELLDELRAERVVLVGQSLGSLVCQRVAVESPGRVIGSVHLGGWSLYPRVSPLMTLFKPLVSLSIALFPRKPLYALFAAHKALEPHTRAYLQEVCTAAGKRLIRLLTLDMVRDMVEGIPHRLDHPMLICHGDHEAGFIRRHAVIWHAAQPGSTLAVIENAHHIANQDNPSAFNGRLIEYLDSVAQAGQIASAAGHWTLRHSERIQRAPCSRS